MATATKSVFSFYFLFSRNSQAANAAVNMHAAALIHNGISAALTVTFHCRISLIKCIIETSNRNITVMVLAGFILVSPFFVKSPKFY
jgi:hypothetical protein